LRRILGGENAFALDQFKRELRLAAMKRRRPPEGIANREDLVRTQAKQIKSFLTKRGLDPKEIRKTTTALFEDSLVLKYTDWAGTVHPLDPAGANPPPPPDPRRNPWVTFNPPFTGWQTGLDHGLVSGFSTGRQALLDPAAGLVGNIVTLDDGDASDFDTGSVIADTQIAFWYQAPIAGLVEVTVIGQCAEGRHELTVEDEWGVSDFSATQQNFLMMHVLHPNADRPRSSWPLSFTRTEIIPHIETSGTSCRDRRCFPSGSPATDRCQPEHGW
jgi:hypothetical protein